jgi:phospholipid N-methyltransferase
MAKDHQFVGLELDLFAQVTNWKAYIRSEIGHYIKGHVLEVGAGIGGITSILFSGREKSWTCLEPDKDLFNRLTKTLDNSPSKKIEFPKAIQGTIDHPDLDRKFDTILYTDVLEHIENDGLEVKKASQKLEKEGVLIVLAPAHQWLFSPYDDKVGHFRRYNKNQLIKIRPPGARLLRLRYLDSIGILASLGNKVILRAGIPTRNQIIMWNRLMVPLSRIFDSAFGYTIGKSIYIVWQKT